MNYQDGDTVYVIVSNRWIKRGMIIKRNRDFLTVGLEEGGMLRLRESRFYRSEEEAKFALDTIKGDQSIWGIKGKKCKMNG